MRKNLLPHLTLFGLLALHSVGLAQSTYSMKIEISEQASVSLTNYQVDLTINTEALILAGKMNADGSDLRFYEDSCLTSPLSHWVEMGINTANTEVWVRVPSIPALTVTTIYIGYGDPLAVSTSSFAATFPSAIISAGSPVNISGAQVVDWLQIDAGDVLNLGFNSPLSISARKIIINGSVNGVGAGSPGGSISQNGFGSGGGTTSVNSGSGGGSYAGVGGTGGFDGGDTPGVGGAIYGTDTGTDFDMGSGGGASDANFGGSGGGAFAMNAEYITITGTINMNATAGQQPGSGRGAGGGSGGSVLAIASDIVLTGTIAVNGGQGSVGTSTANDDGGGGSGGRVKLFYTGSIINTGTILADGGPVGTNGSAAPPQPGAAGVIHEEGLIALDDLVISIGAESTFDFTASIVSTGGTCVGETVTLSAGGTYSSYLWSTSETSASIDVTADGTYELTAGAPFGCGVTDIVTITVTFNPLPVVDLGFNDTICETASITLDAGAGFAAYDWSTGPSTQTVTLSGATLGLGTQTISVDVTDANGCVGTDDLEIVVEDCTIGLDENALAQVVEVYPNPVTDELMVHIEMANDLPTELSITDLSGKRVFNQANFNTQTVQLIDVSLLQAGTYFVEISNSNGRVTRMIVKN